MTEVVAVVMGGGSGVGRPGGHAGEILIPISCDGSHKEKATRDTPCNRKGG
jgi:hypothetical protein